MWSPEEQKALESPDKNTHGVSSTHHHSFESVPASRRTSERSFEHTKRQRVSLNDSAWPSSASGSTATEHEHSVAAPRGQTDVEAVVASKPSPVKFWSQGLKTTRRRVFRKYAVTCERYSCISGQTSIDISQYSCSVSSSSESYQYIGGLCSRSRPTYETRP